MKYVPINATKKTAQKRHRVGDFILIMGLNRFKNMGLDLIPLKLWSTRVQLETGEFEILIIPLLHQQTNSHDQFAESYNLRLPVEDDSMTMKRRIEIESFLGGFSGVQVQPGCNLSDLIVRHTTLIASIFREIMDLK